MSRPNQHAVRLDERVAPHDLVAESAVLGAVLVNNGLLPGVSTRLTAEDFYRDAHRRIFPAMEGLHVTGKPIDLVTLSDALGDDLEQVGGRGYIASLVDGMPRSTNVEHYADIVRRCAKQRALVAQLTELRECVRDDPDTLVNGRVVELVTRVTALVATGAQGLSGLPDGALADGVAVVEEGRALDRAGVPYLVKDIIPDAGELGFLVAYAKTGKNTFTSHLAAAVGMGRPFLGCITRRARVLIIAAEDPPLYTAWLARHLDIELGWLTFYRQPIQLDSAGLARISTTVRAGGYRLVLISSWQSVVRGLIHDENDNAGAVQVVEAVKAAARETDVPWLIDAHAGKGEDQTDEADPARSMRGASSAAGAADFILSLRYAADSTFGTQRKFSGKGRFVNFAPRLIDFDPATGVYEVLGDAKDAGVESTQRLIDEVGVLTTTPQTAGEIAKALGYLDKSGRATRTGKRWVAAALRNRDGVTQTRTTRNGQHTTLYALAGAVTLEPDRPTGQLDTRT